jgi:aminoglycoside phosphotransferase (APT) family kinase protein
VFIKRNLTPSEYAINRVTGDVPYLCVERMKKEVAAIRYVQSLNIGIPTPNIRCAFEDHGRYYIITDLVPGVALSQLPDDKKALVIKELEGYVAQMHAIKSNVMGGFMGDAIVPFRLGEALHRNQVPKFRESAVSEFVLCHNDLSQHNVIVDGTTLKVNAILDWEYAGFYPPEFDGPFYLRPGPSVAIEGEEDDVPKLLTVLEHWKA